MQTAANFLYASEAQYSLMLGLVENLSQRHSSHDVPPLLVHLENRGLVEGVLLRADPLRLLISEWPREALPSLLPELAKIKPRARHMIGPAETMSAILDENTRDQVLELKLSMAQKILQLRELQPPSKSPGSVRLANANDVPLITRWILDFISESTPEDPLEASRARQLIESKIARQQVYVWTLKDRPVSMTHVGRPTKNGVSISAVFTPKDRRGRGYASNLVADVSRRLLRHHDFCVLYTDAANPISNKVYQSIGYQIIAESQMFSISA